MFYSSFRVTLTILPATLMYAFIVRSVSLNWRPSVTHSHWVLLIYILAPQDKKITFIKACLHPIGPFLSISLGTHIGVDKQQTTLFHSNHCWVWLGRTFLCWRGKRMRISQRNSLQEKDNWSIRLITKHWCNKPHCSAIKALPKAFLVADTAVRREGAAKLLQTAYLNQSTPAFTHHNEAYVSRDAELEAV